MSAQYVEFNYLNYCRKQWIDQGHTNVPDPKCSCPFQGPRKPDKCEIHQDEKIVWYEIL